MTGATISKQRRERAARGVCYRCEEPAVAGRKHCARHLHEMRKVVSEWRQDRMRKGICTFCGRRKEKHRRKKHLCVACKDAMRESKRAEKAYLTDGAESANNGASNNGHSTGGDL